VPALIHCVFSRVACWTDRRIDNLVAGLGRGRGRIQTGLMVYGVFAALATYLPLTSEKASSHESFRQNLSCAFGHSNNSAGQHSQRNAAYTCTRIGYESYPASVAGVRRRALLLTGVAKPFNSKKAVCARWALWLAQIDLPLIPASSCRRETRFGEGSASGCSENWQALVESENQLFFSSSMQSWSPRSAPRSSHFRASTASLSTP
jgi:hypothetical protein